jgi:DNA invertase Pin-like site-specific DNA recombinase
MTSTLIGYARCSANKQDLTAQRRALIELGVPRIASTPTLA